MSKKDEIVELLYSEISEVCRLAQRTEDQQWLDSIELADSAVGVLTKQLLTMAELKEGDVTELVHYDTTAAVVFLLGLIEGAVGATTMTGVGMLLVVSSAVVSCLLSLKRLGRRASRAESMVFLAVYESPHRAATRQQVEKRFRELSEEDRGVSETDFAAALQGLLDLGIIKEVGGRLLVTGVTLVF